ncbi:MAG: hypothetical protein PVG83_01170 [Acidimicrobiia bacterium]|jgi:hypothetical protein
MTTDDLQDRIAELERMLDERTNQLEEALGLLTRRNATLTTLAAGFHPYEGDGQRLNESILDDLETGVLQEPVTQVLVWKRAEEAEIFPDFKPLFDPRKETV